MPKLSLQGLLYINTSSVIHDLFINQHIYCYIIILLLSLNSMDICASDPRPPASQLTTNWSVCIYIQLFLNPFPWGQGVDSVSYPGPSIHPIMSLKIYILLYIYVITMEWIE